MNQSLLKDVQYVGDGVQLSQYVETRDGLAYLPNKA